MSADPRDIILRPVVSEKSYGLLESGRYTFEVHPDANKTQVKIAIEQIFADVKVTSVNTINRAGQAQAHPHRLRPPQVDQARHRHAVQGQQGDRRLLGRLSEVGNEPMGIRKYKPTTPGRRGASVADFAEVTRDTPEKSLVRPLHNKGGRNVHGRVTARHQGGGHKRAYRLVDFRRADKDGVPAKVAHIEYDPNRTARIALLHFADGDKRYIIAPNKLWQGDTDRDRPRRRHQAGQQPAAAQHPGRYRRARHRAAARRRREDRPLGRREGAAGRQGRSVRPAADAVRRDPQRRRALPRHRRRGRQRRAGEHQLGQGRPDALEGQAPDASAASP